LTTDRREQVQVADAPAKMEELIGDGSEVLVVTTGRFAAQAAEKAQSKPALRVLQYASGVPTANFNVYSARYHQAWYLSGITAARYAKGLSVVANQDSIGIVAPVSNSQVNRQINAFVRGALSVNPAVKVEVVWANSFVPTQAVTRGLVDYLLAGNSRVIVNRLGTGEVVRYVDTKGSVTPKPVSVGLDNIDACAAARGSCIGSPYWNWGPLYARLFDAIHRGTPLSGSVNESIQFDATKSAFHFALNKAGFPALSSVETEVLATISSLSGANGEDRTLIGPMCPSTLSQRTGGCLTAGQLVSDAEYNNMCWLVEGTFQRADTENPTSALVPAKAPMGDIFWPPKSVDAANIAQPSCVP
jgi:basic membrane lipoprotein Med (substrate-binding protein (PBP1-ABC) superfamily)